MKSLSKLFRFGPGPSSSHTIAPSIAARSFKNLLKGKNVLSIDATLYGSLAYTGKGHHTDDAIRNEFTPIKTDIFFDRDAKAIHPLSMSFKAYFDDGTSLLKHYSSLGGGEIYSNDDLNVIEKDIYPFRNLEDIKIYMSANGIKDIKDFCLQYEDASIDDYLKETLDRMFSSIENSLTKTGFLPTGSNPRLKWERTASRLLKEANSISDENGKREMLITAYAYAVGEANAAGELVVTAPTCGASGLLPAILYYQYKNNGVSKEILKKSLYTAGIFGNVVKQNASIAGAIGGCQAEIGTAAAMAASALSYIDNLPLPQIEYAAEIAIEHFLGLSCDPVDGYVVIPCIERNGIGALRAYDAYLYAKYVAPIRRNQVSFDDVVYAMKLTGDAMGSAYKETAEGGLAKILK